MDSFTGKDPEIRLEDWLPALQRASEWNGWSNADQLLQLAGHLRGRALQEWNLLEKSDKSSYNKAIDALRSRLDPGIKALAAQDFLHSSQGKEESLSRVPRERRKFVKRLEKLYQLAYGGDDLKAETKDALMYGQLYEGLRINIVRRPAVSGSQGYKQLCVSAKAEERMLAALKQGQQYGKQTIPSSIGAKFSANVESRPVSRYRNALQEQGHL